MDYAIYTHTGGRSVNEDSATVKALAENKAVFIVADGLGGHGKGEVASSLVVSKMVEQTQHMDIAEDGFLEESILFAQDELMAEQERLDVHNEMKTTIVALRIFDGKAQWAHVGDSRLYMWRKGKLYTRTLDHSVPQMLVATGEIKEKQIRFHEDRNRLIRVLGTKWELPKYDVSKPVQLEAGDAFLLCSDGFWELLDEKDIKKCLKKASNAEEWIKLMAEIVNKNGRKINMDNNTAVAVII